MMVNNYNQAEDDMFFDAREEVSSGFDWGSDCSDDCSISGNNCFSDSFGYDFWTKDMENVHIRRSRFLRWLGLSLDRQEGEGEKWRDNSCDESELGVYKIGELSESAFRDSNCQDQFLSSRSFLSCQLDEALEQIDDVEENPACTIRNLDDGTMFLVDELGTDGMLLKLRVVGSNQMVTIEEFQETVSSSSLVQRLLQKNAEIYKLVDAKKKVKKSWIRKLGVVTRMVDRKGEVKLKVGVRVGSVHVHSYRKRLKELSSLYVGQDFPAHKGSILTMKFSPDGQYLASGGKDNVVRVWMLVEDERPSTFDISDSDPSCLYFSLNHLSKFTPLDMDKEKIEKVKKLSTSSKSTCIIFPPKIFRILEKPFHEFHGHSGEVLALSWSKKGYLLSSSVDKTVRLWRLGHHQCLRVYCHNNYVTCVEFNPVDDNYFISGSIDGKVRIWEVAQCQVIDWIDLREIVTAVCYYPNGKEGIVGTMDGNCYFYDIINNRLHLGAQICLQGKKKFSGKRVTGFQFCPSDPSIVMVTSADSQVRVLSGVNIMSKFKGTRSSGSLVSASFTSDGSHVISASEDSNVYMWNFNSQDQNSCRSKNNGSSESFLANNASIAIPWCGMDNVPRTLPSPTFSGPYLLKSFVETKHLSDDLQHKMPVSSPDCFSLGRGFFLESLWGSPTWPEERLPSSSPKGVSPSFHKSEYKFLNTAYKNTFSSPHLWGAVIVTAGWDGRIRSYLNYGLPMLA